MEANLTQAKGMRGARLTGAEQGRPYLKGQLWSRTVGKPDVRNRRGERGNRAGESAGRGEVR
jgi:hypothetical protein